MYHLLRVIHRWIGLIASLFLMTLAVTGTLLALKNTTGWVRPAEADGTPIAAFGEVVTLETVTRAAFAVGIPELQEMKHVDRIDYRPKSNVFKVVSREGYHEIQVDGKTGQVVQRAHRIDQFVEDIHDLSLFSDWMNGYFLPLVGVSLFGLGLTGVVIFFVPVFRRVRARKLLRIRSKGTTGV
jgi:uncharacterized iron-regulated membrane protein